MTQPCLQEARIVKLETLVEEHGKKLDKIDEKLDILLEKVAALANNKGFVGGIAAVGILVGSLAVDALRPVGQKILALILMVLK